MDRVPTFSQCRRDLHIRADWPCAVCAGGARTAALASADSLAEILITDFITTGSAVMPSMVTTFTVASAAGACMVAGAMAAAEAEVPGRWSTSAARPRVKCRHHRELMRGVAEI